jgi:cytochrome c oxidase subunit 3
MRTAVAERGRPHQVSPLRLGTLIFLASDLMLFAGLFAAYFTLRSQTHPWPPRGIELETVLASVATVVLVVSSFTLVVALRRPTIRGMRIWIGITMVLGVAFLAIQVIDWFRLPFRVSTNAYGTLFYAMTGFHWLHVLSGVALMAVVLGRAAQGAYAGGDRDGPEAVGYVWHFVDVVWVLLFATLFLIR